MQWMDVIGLLGGLSLFLYGMHFMGDGLELLAGAKLKGLLERVTRNRFVAMLVGIFITAIIQSSNAVTAMTVNFVNVGLLEFSRAIGIIMGSNIGTTITGQLIALNISSIAPAFAFIGVALFLFTRKDKLRYSGQIVAGLGILFMGLNFMASSMEPLREVDWFIDLMTSFQNPFLGVAAGALFTMLIQSSSASVGVLQALALQGLIGLDSAIYVICGQNIGCTIAAVMAAFGGTRGAKRTALVHIMFNVVGTLLFVAFAKLTPFVLWVEALSPGDGVRQIANAHTIFNVVTTAVLLPCTGLMVKAAHLLIPGESEEAGPRLMHIQPVDAKSFGAAAIAIGQIHAEATRMHTLARDNLKLAVSTLFDGDEKTIQQVYDNEEIIDFLNKEITLALVRVNAMELSVVDAKSMASMYHIISDLERIGDHAENIADYAKSLRTHGGSFSAEATRELKDLAVLVFDIVTDAYGYFVKPVPGGLERIDRMEARIDEIVSRMEMGHINRLEQSKCSAEVGMFYVEILTDLERVSDHALNIAEAAHRIDDYQTH